METIHCSKLMDFGNTRRKYYNCSDIRISDVYLHNRDDVHRFHKHNTVTEILYVLEGTIIIKIKEDKIIEYKVNKNNIAIILAGEKHTVCSVDEKARVLVIKYIRKNEDLLETFLGDFEE